MKFYTRELDARIQNEGFRERFLVDPRAAAFDGTFYQELYEAELASHFDALGVRRGPRAAASGVRARD